jgi:predicted peptidase
MNRLHLTYTIFLMLYGLSSTAQDFSKYEKGNFIKKKDTISYRILFPENFDAAKKYPILFFLHGAGERGSDNEKQLVHGGKLFLQEDIRKQFPAIVVFPQCVSDSYWSNVNIKPDANGKRTFMFQEKGDPTKAMHALLSMIDFFLVKPYTDRSRVYAAGLSMGGMGTFELLRRKPKVFAAAFSICGGDNVANVQKYKNVPLWIFHGEKDDVVPVACSTSIADQLKVLGKPVKLTLYPNANHNSWDAAFAEPQLLPWLFSNHK